MDKKEEIKEILKRAYATELERFLSSLEHHLKQGFKYGFVNQDGNISFKIQDWPECWERNNKFFSDRTIRTGFSDYYLYEWCDEFVDALDDLVSELLLKRHVIRERTQRIISKDVYKSNPYMHKLVGSSLRFNLKVR